MQMYEFWYPLSDVRQSKVMISHQVWQLLRDLPDENKECPDKTFSHQMKLLTGGNEWFTDGSPLYNAISTGILLIYDGSYRSCIVSKY